jgi:hypothetical protein
MSATLATALLLQASAVILLRLRLGRAWLRRPVTLLVLASVAYQGLSPLLVTLTDTDDTYRAGIAPGFTDSAVLLLSSGTLALTVCYLLTRTERPGLGAAEDDAALAARALDWRLLALACLPLAVLTYHGRGYNNALAAPGGPAVSADLATTFFTVLVVLAAFAFLLRHGPRLFLPVLAAQSVLLAAAGERFPVIIDAVALVLLLARAGARPSRRALSGALALTVLGVLAITGVRQEQGRSLYYRDTGLGTRVTALGSGLTAGPQPGTPGLIPQAAVRLDGVSFTAAILQARHLGQPRLPASWVPGSLMLAVPSAVYPSKLAHSGALSPAGLEIDDLGLQRINFLPGLGGLYAGFLPPWALVAFLGLLGVLAGWAERWLLRSCTPARLVLLAGAVTAALDFEKGLPGMLVALRAAVVFAIAVKAIEAARERRRRQSRHWTAPVQPLDSVQPLD